MKSRLSVLLTVYNDAQFLEACLESVKWADEIVIVDMYSTDGSDKIFQAYTDKIYFHPHEIIVEHSQNYGISKTTGEWILKLDPDERILPALAHQIQEIVTNEAEIVAFRLPRKDYMFDRWIQYTGWQGDLKPGLIRLFKRKLVDWPKQVHAQPIINGKIGIVEYDPSIDNAIHHVNYTDLTQFIEKLNRYTTAEAQRLYQLKRPFHWLKLFYQPCREFWWRFIQMQGYRDGIFGLILSLLRSFYIMVSYMKLWELERQINNNEKDKQ